MTEQQNELLEQLSKLLKQKESKSWYSQRLGISIDEVNELLQELRGGSITRNTQDVVREDTPSKVLHSHGIDLDTYNISSGWVKDKGISVQFSRTKELDDNLATNIEKILSNYKSTYNPLTEKDLVINNKFTNPCCLFISLTDVHIDKQTVDNQTIEQKIEQYHEVLNSLLSAAYHSKFIDEIVYVIGNDFFNSDTYYTTTTNDTQQFNNCQWEDSYEAAFDCQIHAINKLKQFCNKLTVIHVPSNHDRTKGFFFAHALETYFNGDKNIIFNRTAESTKVYTYGENFIGLHHGDTKLESLPLYFASKFYKEWGSCKFKEIAVGDKHHKKTINVSLSDCEVAGIRVFMTPSMGGYGQWDKYKMFDLTIQSGICRIYDKERGKVAEFEERI